MTWSMSPFSKVVMFADEILMFKLITDVEDLASFQIDIVLLTGCLLTTYPSTPRRQNYFMILSRLNLF